MRPGSDDTVKTIEIGLEESVGNFAGAIGAEVEEEDDVIVAYALGIGLGKDHRRHELIGLVLAVVIRNSLAGEDLARLTFAEHDCVPS